MTELYSNLMKLCEESKSFFFKDEFMLGYWFRIFSYRYCTYTDWLKPGALECRGIMFEMDGGEPIRIASRPMEKFFNLHENEFTANIDRTRIVRVMEKVDGSLISTFTAGPLMFMKSKASLSSDQAMFARNLAYKMGHDFVNELRELDEVGYTVNLEYVAPHNRVILPYQEEKLIVLNVRHKTSGKYMSLRQIRVEFPKIWANYVPGFCAEDHPEEAKALTNHEHVRMLEHIEGFIWVMDHGQMVKVKTDWYVAKHKAKDGALNFRFCLEAVLDEKSDDVRAALHDDPAALVLLNKVEQVVTTYMSSVLDKIEKFHNENKGLSRKDYAIKGQEVLGHLFGLAMLTYSGREIPIQEHCRKQYDMLKQECQVGGPEGLQDE